MSVNPASGVRHDDLGTPSQEEMKQTLFNLGAQLTKAHAEITIALETLRCVAQTLSDLNPE